MTGQRPGPARPEATRLHEAVQGRPRHARELRDGGLGDAQLEEAAQSRHWVSPRTVRHGVKIIYGFQLSRDDPEWDTDSLRLPSAYVGIWRTSPDESCKLPCPSGWKERSKAWQEEYVWGLPDR